MWRIALLGADKSGAVLLCALALAACGSGGGTTNPATVGQLTALGKTLFHDTALSASGLQSCATCHDPKFGFAASDGRAVPLGGVAMDQPGFRNAPSLMYTAFTPAFFSAADGTPTGGFFRDGRAADLAAQAAQPFVSAFEMANADAAAVVARLRTRPYLQQFEDLFGASALDAPEIALQRIAQAIAAYEKNDPEFAPFSSKFDYWRKGQAALTAQELNGLRLFNDPAAGNCAACHPSTPASATTPALFTDFTYDNLGLPRNGAIPANSDSAAPAYTPLNGDDGVHAYYDLGLCGPLRAPIAGRNDLCGAFKVPTLRDIALTAPYFHNGAFATLQDALGFYLRRDTNPEEWYPAAPAGGIDKFNDLPARYHGNVNISEVPYNRPLGGTPALSGDDIKDVIAFLCTLTDGYDPANPSALSLPAQCTADTGATTPTAASSTP